ncbi:MAG: hypothetical protein JSS55_11000 [Proteobacteria bacterium]|nr:hypothetical protein [Pseudomonadota bacterium]
MTDQFPWGEAAMLVWLFPGDNLDEDDFDWGWVSDPPEQNPQSFETFVDAIKFAATADCAHGKGAWVKVGERIFNPVDVFDAHQELGFSGGS